MPISLCAPSPNILPLIRRPRPELPSINPPWRLSEPTARGRRPPDGSHLRKDQIGCKKGALQLQLPPGRAACAAYACSPPGSRLLARPWRVRALKRRTARGVPDKAGDSAINGFNASLKRRPASPRPSRIPGEVKRACDVPECGQACCSLVIASHRVVSYVPLPPASGSKETDRSVTWPRHRSSEQGGDGWSVLHFWRLT